MATVQAAGDVSNPSVTLVPGDEEAPLLLTMTLSREMLAVVLELGRESGQSLETVFEQAIALYRITLQAKASGKHLGLASSSDALEVDFTGFPAR